MCVELQSVHTNREKNLFSCINAVNYCTFFLRYTVYPIIFQKMQINYFCKKSQISCVLGALPHTSCLQQLGALPSGSQNSSLIGNFWLRAYCFHCCYVILGKLILRPAGVYGFPLADLFLNKYAHPWFRHSKNT